MSKDAPCHKIIKVDLQGHGRTADIPERPLTIEQYAKDVVGLLNYLGVPKADFFGESYGASAAVMIAVSKPEIVGRVAAYGATFGPQQVAHNPKMLSFDQPPTPDSKGTQFQKRQYEGVATDPNYWPKLWEKVAAIKWEGFSSEQLASITAPVLIAVGDRDFVSVQHAAETVERIANAELAVIPDAGHFALYSEPERVVEVVKHFLEKPVNRRPVVTAQMGYHPGETR